MKEFALNIPFNQVSFGQVSTAIAREVFRQGFSPYIFPLHGQTDLSSQKVDQEFVNKLNEGFSKGNSSYSRNIPALKLWHINGSLESVAKEQTLITFHETDKITDFEKNILRNQKTVYVTSKYSEEVMKAGGVDNVKYLKLGYDNHNFYNTNKTYIPDKVVFGLFGKLEITRKRTLKTLAMWAKKYGNNPKYVLHAAIANPHMKPEDQSGLIMRALDGKKFWNINFLPMVQSNAEYNDIVNSVNIVLALSGGEAFGLPEFHAVGLGKHCVGLNAHAYKDYLNESNAVLINPSSKIPCYDGIFFHEGQPFNQGNFYDWEEDDAIAAMEQAEQRYLTNPVNIAGQELKKWSYEDTIKEIAENI